MKKHWQGRALITGASSGIGLEYARLFAADGHDVVLVARRKERLDQLAKELNREFSIAATVIAEDLCDPKAPERIHATLSEQALDIDFLINNAGFGSNGAFAELELARELQMVDVNIRALVHLSRLFLPDMLARGRGRILNIGSTAGFQAGPYMATYYASKAFVNHFSEALAHEVRGTGVTVTASCPGPVATEFAGLAGNDRSNLFKGKPATAQAVASQGYRAMHKGKPLVIHGAKNRFAVQLLRLFPRRTVHKVAMRLNSPSDR